MTQVPDLEKLKTFSVQELSDGYALINFTEENTDIEIDYDSGRQHIRNELESRSSKDLVDFILGLI